MTLSTRDQSKLQRAAAELERWLFDDALPLWWRTGADHAGGGFHDAIDHSGQPVVSYRRGRVQARQIYVYAAAGQLGWNGPWGEAAEHGLSFLIDSHLRADGLIRTLVAPGGASLDETATLYDQAFALLALAAGRKALPDRADLEPMARRLLGELQRSRRHGPGGYVEVGEQPFQANAHMHLLEAALAWSDISNDSIWITTADEVAALALDHFIDPEGGFLREFYDDQWRPRAGDDGRLVEPGHQFEWAWLMARWGARRRHPRASAIASRLFETGLRGVDAKRGVAVNALWDDLSTRDGAARLWPQTEWLKAAVALAPGDETHALAAIQGLRKYFDSPIRGLWRDTLRADGRFGAEPAPASSFYHIVCAISVLREGRIQG